MMTPTLAYEQALWRKGCYTVVGVDEVGRGAWAGPVVAGAVIWPADVTEIPALLRDSKKLSPGQRQRVADQLCQSVRWSIGQAEVNEIDTLGIAAATFLAMSRAMDQLSPGFLLIDGFVHPQWPEGKQQAIVQGDAKVASISAAAILAKVYRDQLLEQLDDQYPGYSLAKHKGYGTTLHQRAVRQYGLSPIHRRTFQLKCMQSEARSW